MGGSGREWEGWEGVGGSGWEWVGVGEGGWEWEGVREIGRGWMRIEYLQKQWWSWRGSIREGGHRRGSQGERRSLERSPRRSEP